MTFIVTVLQEKKKQNAQTKTTLLSFYGLNPTKKKANFILSSLTRPGFINRKMFEF